MKWAMVESRRVCGSVSGGGERFGDVELKDTCWRCRKGMKESLPSSLVDDGSHFEETTEKEVYAVFRD